MLISSKSETVNAEGLHLGVFGIGVSSSIALREFSKEGTWKWELTAYQDKAVKTPFKGQLLKLRTNSVVWQGWYDQEKIRKRMSICSKDVHETRDWQLLGTGVDSLVTKSNQISCPQAAAILGVVSLLLGLSFGVVLIVTFLSSHMPSQYLKSPLNHEQYLIQPNVI